MKITKWVDFGQEVEVEINAQDIRSALAEAFEVVTRDRLGEDGPTRYDVVKALSSIGNFFNALSEDQIALLMPTQRKVIAEFLAKAAERFNMPVEVA